MPEALPMLSLSAALDQLRRGLLTPTDLVEACLARIDELEPSVKAWVMVEADGARRQAAEQTREYQRGAPRGPLAGIPVGIKDIIDVAGWPTKAGSPLRENHIAERDAPVVAALRRAGAILLGKTVTTQFACFDPAETRNPHNLDHSPGGSSSGSAAAVACGMCFAALATQTGGSITRPAAYCGIAGLKPTFGAVSTDGVVPVSPRLDHVGFVVRSAQDLEVVWKAINPSVAEPEFPRPTPQMKLRDGWRDASDRYFWRWVQSGNEKVAAASPRSESDGPYRLLAIAQTLVPDMDLEIVSQFGKLCDLLSKEECDVYYAAKSWKLPLSFVDQATWICHREIMAHDAYQFHASSFRSHPEAYLSGLVDLLTEGEAVNEKTYNSRLEYRDAFRSSLNWIIPFVDAILTPSTTTFAPPLSARSTGDPRWNSPFSLSGHPTVCIPTGRGPNNLPWGIQLIGPYHAEPRLIAIAKWIESVLVDKRANE